jgi:hypothetical protein
MLQPKLWDWDGLDNDFNSTAGSTGAGAAVPAIAPAPAQALGMRPTTAAAVVSSGMGMGIMGGGERDDFDEDFDQRVPGDRPTTAGAMMQYGSRAAASGGAGNWGYARQDSAVTGKSATAGIADYGDSGAARRPHTANAARAGQAPGTVSDPKAMAYGEQDVSCSTNDYDEVDQLISDSFCCG